MPKEEKPTETEEQNQPDDAETEPTEETSTESIEDQAAKLRELSDEELSALAEAANDAATWKDRFLRKQAEMDNTVRRIQRDASDRVRYAAEPLIRDLVTVVDNLSRAVDSGASDSDIKSLLDGIKLTYQMCLDTLKKHSIEPIEPDGDAFDPNHHEAMLTVNIPDLDDNVVAQLLERGWKMHDRVIRAAKVGVNKKG